MIDSKTATDRAAWAHTFASKGHVRIPDFLDRGAATRLASHIADRTDWRQIVNSGQKIFELDRETRAVMSIDRQRALDEAVYLNARSGFQFRYEAIRVPEGSPALDALSAFVRNLSGGEVRTLLRTVVGSAAIEFADGQATAFSAGDFLTSHDDDVEGKGRIAAYVLGLTPVWRVDWGGLLLFHEDAEEEQVSGWAPRFNSLDLFRVGKMHSVSLISPSAAAPRVSVTGWLRSTP